MENGPGKAAGVTGLRGHQTLKVSRINFWCADQRCEDDLELRRSQEISHSHGRAGAALESHGRAGATLESFDRTSGSISTATRASESCEELQW